MTSFTPRPEPRIRFVIPAQPEFYVVSAVTERASGLKTWVTVDTDLEPIVAWAVDEQNINYPVTDVAALVIDSVPILRPNGTVANYDRSWTSLAHWLADTIAAEQGSLV